jgi:lipopolysaccharide export system protein LptA
MNSFKKSGWSLPIAAVSLVAGLIGTAMLDATSQAAPARRGGASPTAQSARVGAYQFGADTAISWDALKTGGVRITLTGNAWLSGQGRNIAAQQMSIDVPRNASDISIGRASGNVRMSMALEGGRTLQARGSSLIYRRAENRISVGGGVTVRSGLEGGGTVTATGNTAEVLIGPGTASLNGNVRLTLVKPDTLDGPASFTGPNMTVDLDTGNWKISGGRTKGNFNLKPRAGGQ